eukprot:TRINITY_DN16308_c0_g1_i1.p1 TRINITY_DN16308_c0_g1~~TRINITY_DN16308_c0_g1_i1.p1  ORF type:complete len:847 (-),score=98.44 TRINITY_DN16308_c0_g1_i1:552-3092(-)
MDNSASQELVASNPEPRNWKGIVISILCILFVILLVAVSVVWMTPPDPGPRVKGERIRLDTILDGKFKPNSFNASWFQGSRLVYINIDGGLSVFDARTKMTKELLDNATFRTLNSNNFKISDDLKHIMIVHDSKRVFRYSAQSKYTIQSLENRNLPLIKVGTAEVNDASPSQEYLQYAEFVPGGGVVFVKHNNIFYKPNMKTGVVHKVTLSGLQGTIYNGVADWLYEEEILGQSEALWVSKDGSRLAYVSFNDSLVESVTLREYGTLKDSGAPIKESQLREKTFRYPKAGSTNPTVEVFVHMFREDGKGKTVKMVPPEEVKNQDHYVCAVNWVSADSVAVLWMNRLQNTSFHTMCLPPQYICLQIHVERVSENGGIGWVENRGLPKFKSTGKEMVLIEPIRDGDAGYFPQLVHGKVSTSQIIPAMQLTQGQFEVTKVVGWDENENMIYYMATLPAEPGVRHLFRKSTENSATNRTCLTCQNQQKFDLGVSNGTLMPCDYSEVIVSPGFEAYVQHCLGPDIPSTHIYSLPDNTLIWTMDTNGKLHDQVSVSSMPSYEEFSIHLPGTNFKARVKLTLPPVLREEEDFTFPLLINVYGGPGTQTVSSKWSVGWDTYLASQRNFIVASVDVRGTGFQGDDFKHAIFRKLGSYEVTDTLHVIRHLADKLPYIDDNKICVWGWSYGGYLTGMILAEDGRLAVQGRKRLLSCGIAVAPVTQWHNYDSAYTERFMGMPTPESNWKGFTESSLTGKAEYIADNTFMVVHGTGDDNVHVQHTMMLSKSLVNHHIIFRQQIYPDEAHGLYGVIKHEHQTMEAFLDDVYGPIEDFFENDYYLAAAKLLEKYAPNGGAH